MFSLVLLALLTTAPVPPVPPATPASPTADPDRFGLRPLPDTAPAAWRREGFTKYTEVIPKYTKVDYDDSCDAGFTHVVTSVTYGMDANMNFKYILQ